MDRISGIIPSLHTRSRRREERGKWVSKRRSPEDSIPSRWYFLGGYYKVRVIEATSKPSARKLILNKKCSEKNQDMLDVRSVGVADFELFPSWGLKKSLNVSKPARSMVKTCPDFFAFSFFFHFVLTRQYRLTNPTIGGGKGWAR